jgi:hypothetical protein
LGSEKFGTQILDHPMGCRASRPPPPPQQVETKAKAEGLTQEERLCALAEIANDVAPTLAQNQAYVIKMPLYYRRNETGDIEVAKTECADGFLPLTFSFVDCARVVATRMAQCAVGVSWRNGVCELLVAKHREPGESKTE